MRRDSTQLLLVTVFSVFLLTTLGILLFGSITEDESLLSLILIFFGLSIVSYLSMVIHGVLSKS
jgi:ABC-type transport system involved in cytochrome c biogenesis permease subunit